MISAKYPNISQAWLLTGEGGMFTEESIRRTSIPFYDADIEKYVAAPARFTCKSYISLPIAEDAGFGAVYYGRAMGEAIPVGSIAVARRIEPDNLIPGGDYVAVTDDYTILRRIRREVGSDMLRLQPVDVANFDEITVPLSAIRELYLIKAVIINKTI
jgi:hypothetical protein